MASWGGPRSPVTRLARVSIVVLLLGGVLSPSALRAQVGEDDRSDVPELQRGYDEAVALEAELLAAYDASAARLAELNEQIVALDASIQTTEAELLGAEQFLREREDELHVTEVRLAEVEAELGAAEHQLHERAVEAYIIGGDEAALIRAFLAAETVDDYRSSRVYAEAIIEDQDRIVDDYLTLRDDAEQLRSDAARVRDEALGARDEVASRQLALVDEREAHRLAQVEIEAESLVQADLISLVQTSKADYQLRLAVLQGTSDSISQILQQRQAGQTLPPDTAGIFARPVPGSVTSDFGPRLHPIHGEVRQHNGLDMSGGFGQPVTAAESGVVVVADSRGGYGNTVVIDHGNALATVHAHLSSFAVQPGQVVQRGQLLGAVGSTGFSTGPHLHWEVRVLGAPVDPVPFME